MCFWDFGHNAHYILHFHWLLIAFNMTPGTRASYSTKYYFNDLFWKWINIICSFHKKPVLYFFYPGNVIALLPLKQILHHHIAVVEKLSLTTSGCPLVIHCRNFRVVHFVIPRERDCHDIYSSLLLLRRPGAWSMQSVWSTGHVRQGLGQSLLCNSNSMFKSIPNSNSHSL